MKSYKLLILFAIILLISGCNSKSYPSISLKTPVIATVNIKESSISFINEVTKEIMTTWKMDIPFSGAAIFPDNDTLLVYGRLMEDTKLFSLSKGKEIATLPTGKGVSNAIVSSKKGLIFLANQQTNAIQIYDLDSNFIKEVKVHKEPLTLVEDSKRNKLYIVHFGEPIISTVDLETLKEESVFEGNKRAVGAVLLNEDELWVGGHGAGKEVQETISIYSLTNQKLTKEISAKMMPVAFEMIGNDVFSLSHGSNTLRKINSLTYEVTGELEVGANSFAISTNNEELYIASYDSNELIIVNPNTMSVSKKVKVGEGPFQVLYLKEMK